MFVREELRDGDGKKKIREMNKELTPTSRSDKVIFASKEAYTGVITLFPYTIIAIQVIVPASMSFLTHCNY